MIRLNPGNGRCNVWIFEMADDNVWTQEMAGDNVWTLEMADDNVWTLKLADDFVYEMNSHSFNSERKKVHVMV